MRTPAFEMPDLTQVENLMVERIGETTLQPESPVLCINRGRKPLEVTWNANHLTIPVGVFRTEYAAALHMKKHLIVPGTRTEVGGWVSWVGILGSDDGRIAVDPPSAHVPFTDEELGAFGEPIEAIERSGTEGVATVRVAQARAMSRSQGVGGLRPQISANEQATPAAAEAAAHVFDPPAESETRAAQSEAAAEAEPSPRPRPMRKPR